MYKIRMPNPKWTSRSNPPQRSDGWPCGTADLRRQAAQRTWSSCSVMHSRQKKRPQAGQRAAASRRRWLWQRWWVISGMGWLIMLQNSSSHPWL